MAITTLSEFSKSRIVATLGVDSDRIVVTYSGVDGTFAEPSSSPVERPYLLCVGRTYPHKNAARLVRAFDRVASEIPHALVLLGKPDRGEPPSHPRVKRIYGLDIRSLGGLYQHADLHVYPSLYEGFGRPLVEAQEAGTRVVASNAAAIPEIAGSGATYFNPRSESSIAEAILAALREPANVRTGIIQAGRENSRRFTWEFSARETLHAIRLAFESNGNR
ncbi:MAG: hypothetical protein AMXMBFR84_44460 [Candidatus Hydrogenedentota bacterium]